MHGKAPRLVLLNEVKNLFKIPRCTWNNKLFVYFLDLFIYSTEQVFTIFIIWKVILYEKQKERFFIDVENIIGRSGGGIV